MTHILHREIRHNYPIAVGGEGIYLIDKSGRRYIDASGGAAVSCLGHQHPDVLRAMQKQLEKLAYAHTSFFTSETAESLADKLTAKAPGDLKHVYFVSGGSEAVEASLKLARQYFFERGELDRRYFIARRQSYHGNTLGALAIGGNAWRRKPFAPILSEAHHIAPCYEYRHRARNDSLETYGEKTANELEAKLLELGPKNVIAFIAEPVVGATLGAVPAVPGYFRRIREICDHYGILLILDEVMCGMGRTGSLYACDQEGIAPDILTVAKGLGGGYAPIGAAILSEQIYKTLKKGSGVFQHGHTYIGHPLACAAALEVQKVIERDDLLTNVKIRGLQLECLLKETFKNHPYVGDIRGRGLFFGIELVVNRETKAPFDPKLKVHSKIKAAAFENNLLIYPMGGTMDGLAGDHILLAPPFISTAEQITEVVEKLETVVTKVTNSAITAKQALYY